MATFKTLASRPATPLVTAFLVILLVTACSGPSKSTVDESAAGQAGAGQTDGASASGMSDGGMNQGGALGNGTGSSALGGPGASQENRTQTHADASRRARGPVPADDRIGARRRSPRRGRCREHRITR